MAGGKNEQRERGEDEAISLQLRKHEKENNNDF